MDATKLLKKDHDEARTLFKKYKALGDEALGAKAEMCERIVTELETHMAIEEEIFYPALQHKRSEEVNEQLAEGLEEHLAMKRILADLKDMTPGDAQYDAKVKVLSEEVEHHMSEEEEDMFEEARKLFSRDDLDDIGTQLEESRAVKIRAEAAQGRSGQDAAEPMLH